MEPRKQAIIAALEKFMAQRPNLASLGYGGNWAAWRKETREVARDRREALLMLRQIELVASITAETMLRFADQGGRLTIEDNSSPYLTKIRVEYCAGQSYGHEFRGAVARYAASVLWDHMREHCMPRNEHGKAYETYGPKPGGGLMSAGDWLRNHFRRQFGRGMASRWFN